MLYSKLEGESSPKATSSLGYWGGSVLLRKRNSEEDTETEEERGLQGKGRVNEKKEDNRKQVLKKGREAEILCVTVPPPSHQKSSIGHYIVGTGGQVIPHHLRVCDISPIRLCHQHTSKILIQGFWSNWQNR